jgi:diadenylate cyclase
VTLLLPLRTFDWLIQRALMAILFATPLIFQPELRYLLERVGRQIGITPAIRQTTVENVVAPVVRAVERLSASQTGALIVLEGKVSLQRMAETGVAIGGEISSELLQAIFYPKNPLHDGAIILHEDRLLAAGCVLPVAQHPLPGQRRLGTRHRAAVGLSESSDALVIVVSEESGTISTARDGHLQRRLESASLRQQLLDFYVPASRPQSTIPLKFLLNRLVSWLRQLQFRPQQLLANVSLFLVSLLLALIAWWGSLSGG